MSNNVDTRLQRTQAQQTAGIKNKTGTSESKSADSSVPTMNRPATTQYLNLLSRERAEVGESMARSMNKLNQSLTNAANAGEKAAANADSASESMAVYSKLANKVISRDQTLQERVAQNLSTNKKLVRSRDAADTLQGAMNNLPKALKEGTPAGKELAKFVVESLVTLTDTKNMGAGLERDLAVRHVAIPKNPPNLRTQQATNKILAASIAYIQSNQPEVLEELSKISPKENESAPQNTTAQVMTRYLKQALSEFPEDSTYLDIFKQGKPANKADGYADRMSEEIARRIHNLISNAASSAKNGNLINLSPDEADKFDRNQMQSKLDVDAKSSANKSENSALNSIVSKINNAGGEYVPVSSTNEKGEPENVRNLSLSDLTARAAQLQKQFREDRQRIVEEGRLPNPAPMPEVIFKNSKQTAPTNDADATERQQAIDARTKALTEALARTHSAIAQRLATFDGDDSAEAHLNAAKNISGAVEDGAETAPKADTNTAVKNANDAAFKAAGAADKANQAVSAKGSLEGTPLDASALKNVATTLQLSEDDPNNSVIKQNAPQDLSDEALAQNNKAIEALKIQARQLAAAQGNPILPGEEVPVSNLPRGSSLPNQAELSKLYQNAQENQPHASPETRAPKASLNGESFRPSSLLAGILDHVSEDAALDEPVLNQKADANAPKRSAETIAPQDSAKAPAKPNPNAAIDDDAALVNDKALKGQANGQGATQGQQSADVDDVDLPLQQRADIAKTQLSELAKRTSEANLKTLEAEARLQQAADANAGANKAAGPATGTNTGTAQAPVTQQSAQAQAQQNAQAQQQAAQPQAQPAPAPKQTMELDTSFISQSWSFSTSDMDGDSALTATKYAANSGAYAHNDASDAKTDTDAANIKNPVDAKADAVKQGNQGNAAQNATAQNEASQNAAAQNAGVSDEAIADEGDALFNRISVNAQGMPQDQASAMDEADPLVKTNEAMNATREQLNAIREQLNATNEQLIATRKQQINEHNQQLMNIAPSNVKNSLFAKLYGQIQQEEYQNAMMKAPTVIHEDGEEAMHQAQQRPGFGTASYIKNTQIVEDLKAQQGQILPPQGDGEEMADDALQGNKLNQGIPSGVPVYEEGEESLNAVKPNAIPNQNAVQNQGGIPSGVYTAPEESSDDFALNQNRAPAQTIVEDGETNQGNINKTYANAIQNAADTKADDVVAQKGVPQNVQDKAAVSPESSLREQQSQLLKLQLQQLSQINTMQDQIKSQLHKVDEISPDNNALKQQLQQQMQHLEDMRQQISKQLIESDAILNKDSSALNAQAQGQLQGQAQTIGPNQALNQNPTSALETKVLAQAQAQAQAQQAQQGQVAQQVQGQQAPAQQAQQQMQADSQQPSGVPAHQNAAQNQALNADADAAKMGPNEAFIKEQAQNAMAQANASKEALANAAKEALNAAGERAQQISKDQLAQLQRLQNSANITSSDDVESDFSLRAQQNALNNAQLNAAKNQANQTPLPESSDDYAALKTQTPTLNTNALNSLQMDEEAQLAAEKNLQALYKQEMAQAQQGGLPQGMIVEEGAEGSKGLPFDNLSKQNALEQKVSQGLTFDESMELEAQERSDLAKNNAVKENQARLDAETKANAEIAARREQGLARDNVVNAEARKNESVAPTEEELNEIQQDKARQATENRDRLYEKAQSEEAYRKELAQKHQEQVQENQQKFVDELKQQNEAHQEDVLVQQNLNAKVAEQNFLINSGALDPRGSVTLGAGSQFDIDADIDAVNNQFAKLYQQTIDKSQNAQQIQEESIALDEKQLADSKNASNTLIGKTQQVALDRGQPNTVGDTNIKATGAAIASAGETDTRVVDEIAEDNRQVTRAQDQQKGLVGNTNVEAKTANAGANTQALNTQDAKGAQQAMPSQQGATTGTQQGQSNAQVIQQTQAQNAQQAQAQQAQAQTQQAQAQQTQTQAQVAQQAQAQQVQVQAQQAQAQVQAQQAQVQAQMQAQQMQNQQAQLTQEMWQNANKGVSAIQGMQGMAGTNAMGGAAGTNMGNASMQQVPPMPNLNGLQMPHLGSANDDLNDEFLNNLMHTVPSDEIDDGMLRSPNPLGALGAGALSGVVADTELTGNNMPPSMEKYSKNQTILNNQANVLPTNSTPGAAQIRAGENAPIPDESVVARVTTPKESSGFLKRMASLLGIKGGDESSPSTNDIAANYNANKTDASRSTEQAVQVSLRQNPIDHLMSRLQNVLSDNTMPPKMQEQAESFMKALKDPVADLHSVSSWLNFVTGPMSPSSSQALAMHQWAFMLLCIRFQQLGKDVSHFLKKTTNIESYMEMEPQIDDSKKIADDRAADDRFTTRTGELLKDTFGQVERLQQQMQLTPQGVALPRYIPFPPNYQGGREGGMSYQKKEDEDGGTSWNLNFDFDLEKLGQIQIKVKLRFPEVQLSFVAERPEALNKIQECMPVLNEKLREVGLNSQVSNARLGKISHQIHEEEVESTQKSRYKYEGNIFNADA